MADKKENTETEDKAESKPKAAAKEKTKPKAKAKAKTRAKPKAQTKAKSTTEPKKAETAPYLKVEVKAESSKKSSSNVKIFLVVFVALILLTVYKFNEEHSDTPVQGASQETVAADITEAEVPASMIENTTDKQSSDTPEIHSPPVFETTRERSRLEAQERAEKHEEMIQQRRRDFEKEIQLRQKKYNELLAAREQERAKIAEIQQQIYDLHEEIHRLIQESRKRRSPL